MYKYKLNYQFQKPNAKDYTYKVENHSTNNNLKVINIIKPSRKTKITTIVTSIPLSFQLLLFDYILDQLEIGSCVANAFSWVIWYQTKQHFTSSRLYNYAISRIIDFIGLDQDLGTTVRTACIAYSKWGALLEKDFPYITSKFNEMPSLATINKAKFFKQFTYIFINQDINSIKNCLFNKKSPIIFGLICYSSFFNTSNDGIVSIPNLENETIQGGHCMIIVGYNDFTKYFTCINSWSKSWGKNGICYVPYDYILNPLLASDFCFTEFIY